MSIEKNFHHWSSELPASLHGPSSLNGPHWPCTLACTSEDQWWKKFLMLILSSYGHKVSKKCTPNFVLFVGVRAALQPHVKGNLKCGMKEDNERKIFISNRFWRIRITQNFTFAFGNWIFSFLKNCIDHFFKTWDYSTFFLPGAKN